MRGAGQHIARGSEQREGVDHANPPFVMTAIVIIIIIIIIIIISITIVNLLFRQKLLLLILPYVCI